MAGIDKQILDLQTKLQQLKHAYAEEFEKRVKEKTPVRTGDLQRGWKASVNEDSITVENPVEYAAFVEYGTDKMAPRGMLRATRLEHAQILEVAKRKVGMK